MQKASKAMEYETTTQANDEKKSQGEKKEKVSHAANGELRFYGVRGTMMNPSVMCEKLDKMFGSGAEAIVHYMQYESGRDTLDMMIKDNQGKSNGELLKILVDLQPSMGWGFVSLSILHADPPMVDIAVRNPPVKTLKGSQKQVISSFWAGILSRYFDKQLVSKNRSYDADKDEFTCTVTT